MATTFNVGTLDRQSNRSTMSMGVLTASSDVALQAVVTAIDAVIIGSDASGSKTVSTVIDAGSALPATSVEANRGNKWLLRVQDAVNGKVFTHEIGCADNTQLATSSDDFLDLTAGTGLALKTAVDAVYESPYGNAGALVSVQQINRAG